MKKAPLVLSVLATAWCVALTFLFIRYYNGGEVNSIDPVAVLGILVTVLMGWQIYSVISIETRLYKKVESAKKEMEQKLDVLKDFNRPPYLDIFIREYKDPAMLDAFKEGVYGILNNYPGYRILDMHTFTKVNFMFGTDLDCISLELVDLKKKYGDSIDFDFHIVVP